MVLAFTVMNSKILTFGDSDSSLLSVSRFSDGGFEIFTLSTGGSLVGFSGTDCFDDLLSFQDFKFLATRPSGCYAKKSFN